MLNIPKRCQCSLKSIATNMSEDQITITGLAGAYPSANDTKEFMEKLMNKEDCCTIDTGIMIPGCPRNAGRLKNRGQFDNGFFNVKKKRAEFMELMHKMLLQRAYEAILDAGLHPDDIKGTNTGVFVGTCVLEVGDHNMKQLEKDVQMPTGNLGSMIANHLSFILEVNGPSFNSDTACSSGMYAFEEGYRAIREGRCDMAIICSSNTCLSEISTVQFNDLGVLNNETGCRPFDNDATGYTRSEAAVVIVLQKLKDAKRVYAKVLHSKTNSDGYKEVGITFPSADCQGTLIKEVLEEARADPASIAFVEAHGTGTRAGDPEELSALDKFFKPTVEKPLLLGSIKGNIGHSEPASGLCSITKVLFMLNFGTFVPNIHYDAPRKEVSALVEGRMKVVTEVEKLPQDARRVAINCFGFGGANGNVILEKFEKDAEKIKCDFPRLVCFSARTVEAIRHFQKQLMCMADNTSGIRLLHEIFRKSLPQHPYRSYVILKEKNVRFADKYCNNLHKTLGVIIGSCNKYTFENVKEYLKVPGFRKTFTEVKTICDNNGIKIGLEDTKLNTSQESLFTAILQLCLLNLLSKHLQLNFDGVYGSSVSAKLVAAFVSKKISMPQAVMALNIICENKSDIESKIEKVVGIRQAKEILYNNNCLQKKKVSSILNVDFDDNHSSRVISINLRGKVESLLEGLGQLYLRGFNFELANLYNDISLPVGQGAFLISPLIKWKSCEHRYNFNTIGTRTDVKTLDMSLSTTKFYEGHIIDERILLPATGYLYQVWMVFAKSMKIDIYKMCVLFEKVKFYKATPMELNSIVKLGIVINPNGFFEISEKDSIVVTGYIRNIKESVRMNCCRNPQIPGDKEEIYLSSKDVYKELRLRGYNYRGEFRGIQEVSSKAAKIKWEQNWITFLDNMLQVAILQKDSRNLYIPVGIESLYIDCKSQTLDMKAAGDKYEDYLTVFWDSKTQIIRNEYVEIRGLQARSIQKRKQRLQPILETHKFIPNEFECSLEESVRINAQLLLECQPSINFKVIELLPKNVACVSSFFCNAFSDLPLLTPNLIVVSSEEHSDIEKVTVQTKITDGNLLSIVHSLKNLNDAFNATLDNGFVLCVSSINNFNDSRFTILTKHTTGKESVVYLLRKKTLCESNKVFINVSKQENVQNWLETVQKEFSNKKEVILIAEQSTQNGILGFVNCLRCEPGGNTAKCIFLMDTDCKFNYKDIILEEQLEKGLPINVLKNGKWGTYRHLLLSRTSEVPCDHIYANSEKLGDLSSLKWRQGPLRKQTPCIKVAYSALNFRDLMLAYGKISPDAVIKDRFQQDMIQGLEFSGQNEKGERIYGMAKGAIANLIENSDLEIKVPESWSLEDAATVLVVYSTCLLALQDKAGIRKGQSILIHSGCGGIGLAALNICTYYECNIFVTVGTERKEKYLLENYPGLKASHIGNSRNKSFKQMILKETGGKGVDLILNSLSEDKLKTSVECLAIDGIFLEIGKFDLEMNNDLQLDFLNRGCTYIGVMLDVIINSSQVEQKKHVDGLLKSVSNGFKEGYIKPLPRTVFAMNELEKAFRFMATGKHIGKVLIKVDREIEKLPGLPKFYCDPRKSYIVFGGLGGFGLELCDWMILRRARNLIISSRNGPQSGYQKHKLSLWKSYGVNVSICMENVLTEEGCRIILCEANKLGPVDGIFNLAVVLKDAILANQTAESMLLSCGPKATLTQHLDKLTRKMCPDLTKFVVFSSVSCGRGNAGQTNYGYSNSVMERICELRHQEGLPAVAIQWGAVGDVGLLEDLQKDKSEITIGGTLQQKISNCLEVLDKLMQQPEPIVSSMIVAEKFNNAGSDNVVEVVARILGLKNIKSISMHSAFPELGMDSMMGVEIKQTLERDFDIVLSANDILTMTFCKLENIINGEIQSVGSESGAQRTPFDVIALSLQLVHVKELMLSINKNAPNWILGFPGIEGASKSFEDLAKVMNTQIKYPNYNVIGHDSDNTIDSIAHVVYEEIKNEIPRSFKIVSHSYGCFPALKLAADLEKEFGAKGTIALIDSAPLLITKILQTSVNITTDDFDLALLEFIIVKLSPSEDLQRNMEAKAALKNLNNFDERIELLQGVFKLRDEDKDDLKQLANAFRRRIYSVLQNTQTCLEPRLKSNVFLYKPKVRSVSSISEDYDLSKWCEQLIIKEFDGNHQTILENLEMLGELKSDLKI